MMKLSNHDLYIFDGAMGTELYERGHFINRPFEELNLNAPSEVKAVHLAYIQAGAQVITTNTFSAARTQLQPYDLDQKQEQMIRAAVSIAHEARKESGADVKIALSLGPLGALLEPEFTRTFAKLFGNRPDIEALGLNCSEGPSDLFTSLSILRPLTSKPIVIQPNAGIPRQINGRYFYMTSPDYLAKFAKRFAEAGAQGVGGCCGTRPIHIEAIARGLRMAQAKASYEVEMTSSDQDETRPRIEPVPLKSLAGSKVANRLASGKKVFSVDINPPQGTDLSSFFEKIIELDRNGVELINIPDGARATITTRDRNLIALQSDLLGIAAHGVNDVLLITGDPPKLGQNREATAVYDIDSIGLTYLVNCLNHSQTPSGETLKKGTQFGIGVASNPTAIRLDEEYQRFLYKVESGAHYAVTQPIYDPESYLRWMDRLGKNAVPHIVGIWPPVSLRNMEFMANEVPGVLVPEWVLEKMARCESKEESIQAGIEIATQVMESLEDACAGFCISAPLGRTDIALDLVRRFQ